MFGLSAAAASSTPSFLQAWGEMLIPALAHDIMAYLAFALYVALILFGGLAAVLARNLVRALIGLVVTFLGVAGMYLLLASPFLAFMQLLIYIGAICVLIFFAIMLVKNTSSGEEMRTPSLGQTALALLAGLASLLLFGPVLLLNSGYLSPEGVQPTETELSALGEGLLTYYVAPFELISVVLLVAMAGGAWLAWDKRYRAQK